MKFAAAMAEHIASKRTPHVVIPRNGICPTSNRHYFECRCDNHRCGTCGRRWSQRSEHGTTTSLVFDCQCERNRRRNGSPPFWRKGLIAVVSAAK